MKSVALGGLLIALLTATPEPPAWTTPEARSAEARYKQAIADAEDRFRKAQTSALEDYIASMKRALASAGKAGNTEEIPRLTTAIQTAEATLKEIPQKKVAAEPSGPFEMAFEIHSSSDWTGIRFPGRAWQLVAHEIPVGAVLRQTDDQKEMLHVTKFPRNSKLSFRVKFNGKPVEGTPLVLEKGDIGETKVTVRLVGSDTKKEYATGGGREGANVQFDGAIVRK